MIRGRTWRGRHHCQTLPNRRDRRPMTDDRQTHSSRQTNGLQRQFNAASCREPLDRLSVDRASGHVKRRQTNASSPDSSQRPPPASQCMRQIQFNVWAAELHPRTHLLSHLTSCVGLALFALGRLSVHVSLLCPSPSRRNPLSHAALLAQVRHTGPRRSSQPVFQQKLPRETETRQVVRRLVVKPEHGAET